MQSDDNNKFKLASKYFNFHGTGKEQNLVNSLIKEAIHLNGINMSYIPRRYVNLDKIYGEDTESAFEKTFDMVFYVEDSESYQGNHSFLGSFGLDIQDQSTIILSRDVWKQVVVDDVNNDNAELLPASGDLIYNSVMDRIFEITDVEEYQLFYQLGKQYTYKLTIEFFDYSGETINTGISDIDDQNKDHITKSYEVTLKTVPSGSDPVYQVDEQVYIGDTLITADFTGTVKSYNPSTRKIVIHTTSGELSADEFLTGNTSGADLEIESFIEVSFAHVLKDNDEIETKAAETTIVDPEDDDFGYTY